MKSRPYLLVAAFLLLYQLTNLSGGMEYFLSFKNCALRLKTVPVCLAQLLRCQSVAMLTSRLPFALNLTKTTSAIPPDRLVHWYNNGYRGGGNPYGGGQIDVAKTAALVAVGVVGLSLYHYRKEKDKRKKVERAYSNHHRYERGHDYRNHGQQGRY